MTTDIQTLRIETIRTNGGTQTRVQMNETAVKEYGEAMTDGAKMPPITVFFDGNDYWLADGFHRVQASMNIGALSIDAEVRHGDQRAARLFSAGANSLHGVQRTNADKRRAVTALLSDEEWGDWGDRDIARQCKVSKDLVLLMRKELDEPSAETHPAKEPDSDGSDSSDAIYLAKKPDSAAEKVRKYTRGGKTYEMKTGGIAEANKKRAKTSTATAPESTDESPGPVKTIKPKNGDPIVEALQAENAQLREEIAEMKEFSAEQLKGLEETLADASEMQKVFDADDKLAAAMERIKQMTAEIVSLRERQGGLTNEKNEAVRLSQSNQRRADKAEKALKELGHEPA